MIKLNYRQVHLDFHTSEEIDDIGESFDKEDFIEALKEGHVNSITLFSKCHHGWAYHPSKANVMHPHLKFDLLGAQLEACREAKIHTCVYLSAGIDARYIKLHPECAVKPKPGSGIDFLNHAGFYQLLCFNSPYLEVLAKQVEEVMERYNPSGIFLDLCSPQICYCQNCIASMREKGLDPKNESDMRKHADFIYDKYCQRMERAVRKYNADTTIFHNGGVWAWGRRAFSKYDSHLEIESLPTGGWGYDHFPLSAAYVRTLGKEFLGMTGKFHKAWGDFGGFKHPNALRYEVALSLAEGAKCSIGDQLHPSGKMNHSTYRLIGEAYSEVELKEPYVEGAEAIADIAILSSTSFADVPPNNLYDTGASRILLEGKYLYNVIDSLDVIDKYKLLVLPDVIRVNADQAKKLEKFVAKGGKILMSGESGLYTDKDEFAIETGAECQGKSEFCPSYMIPKYDCVNGKTEYVMYTKCMEIKATFGEVQGIQEQPYFNRTPEHFCSHSQTPNKPDADKDGAVLTRNTGYICWNVFEDYARNGSFHVKELVLHMIHSLLPNPTVTTNLPDRGIVTLTHQEKENRFIAHLLFAYTTHRGENTEVIEDTVPLFGIKLTACLGKAPLMVYKLWCEAGKLCREELEYTIENGRISINVGKVDLHTMIVMEM